MNRRNYPKNAPIVLPKSTTFKYRTAVNANPKCAAITVQRRLNDMIAAGSIIRIKQGVYRKADGKQLQLKLDNKSHSMRAADVSLYDFLRLDNNQKVKLMEKALKELVKEGVVSEHDNRYSVVRS